MNSTDERRKGPSLETTETPLVAQSVTQPALLSEADSRAGSGVIRGQASCLCNTNPKSLLMLKRRGQRKTSNYFHGILLTLL